MYNLVSVKKVIAKVFADLDLHEETHRITDMIEWAGEAIEKIGAITTLEKFVTGKGLEPLLKIVDYQAQLPVGLHSIIQVAYSPTESGPYYSMRKATGSFDSVRGVTKATHNEVTLETTYELEDESLHVEMDYTDDLTYIITPGYIKTNVRDGYLMMAYNRIPLDEEGFPMIPEHTSFMEAVYWYIVVKLTYPKWALGNVRDAVYYNARNSWNFYCKQAYGVAMMPKGVDEMESLKNAWLRIVPEMHEHRGFFNTTGQEQHIYNAN